MSLMEVYEELHHLSGEQFEAKKNEIMHTHLYAMSINDIGELDRGRLDRLYFRQQGIEKGLTKNPLVNARRLIDQAAIEICKLNQPIPERAEVKEI